MKNKYLRSNKGCSSKKVTQLYKNSVTKVQPGRMLEIPKIRKQLLTPSKGCGKLASICGNLVESVRKIVRNNKNYKKIIFI